VDGHLSSLKEAGWFFGNNCAIVYFMETVTLTKNEYSKLKRESAAYRKITARVFESVVKDDIPSVIDDFRKTELYTEEFLRDLEDGLRKSSYGKA
jgi:hypothetical protein